MRADLPPEHSDTTSADHDTEVTPVGSQQAPEVALTPVRNVAPEPKDAQSEAQLRQQLKDKIALLEQKFYASPHFSPPVAITSPPASVDTTKDTSQAQPSTQAVPEQPLSVAEAIALSRFLLGMDKQIHSTQGNSPRLDSDPAATSLFQDIESFVAEDRSDRSLPPLPTLRQCWVPRDTQNQPIKQLSNRSVASLLSSHPTSADIRVHTMVMQALKRASRQAFVASQAGLQLVRAALQLSDLLTQPEGSVDLYTLYSQITGLLSASHIAVLDSLEQTAFAVSSTAILRRDAILSQFDRRVSRDHLHKLRAAPFMSHNMFPEGLLQTTRRELDRRRDHEHSSLHRRREFSPQPFTSIQYDSDNQRRQHDLHRSCSFVDEAKRPSKE